MTTKFQLGTYLGLAAYNSDYDPALASFTSLVGEAPTLMNTGIDYTQPMSNWVSAAKSAAGYLASTPGGTGNTPLFSLPLMSTADSTPTLAAFQAIASGADDAIWTGIVKAFEADGFKAIYLRPGWEMNGNWYPWSVATAAEATAYVAAFDHIATVVHAITGITVEMVWNPDTMTNTPVSTASIYPGNNYVDVVGVDLYNSFYPNSLYDWSTGKMDTSMAQWLANPVNQEHYWNYPDATPSAPTGTGAGFGLVDALTLAVENGKPFGLPETGDAGNGTTTGPLSNPLFPEYLAQMLLANGAPSIQFVSIWDKFGTSAQFTQGASPAVAAAWADFVRKMNQGDAGPSVKATAPGVITTTTVAHGQVTNLASALMAQIVPGRTGDTETISNVSATSGSVAVGSNGAVNYTAGAAGTDTITYTVTDQFGDSVTTTAQIVIDGGPSINAATVKLAHGATVSLASLGLVTAGVAGDTETFSNVTAGHGTITVAANGTFLYTAPAGGGTDTLHYTVTDQAGDSITGSSSLTIDAGPTLTAGNKAATAGQSWSNFTYYLNQQIAPGLTGDTETITAVSASAGTVTLANGNVSYTAPSSGRDTITYTVTDQLGDTATGTYSVTVNPATVSGKVLSYAAGGTVGAADPGVTVSLLTTAGAVVATATSTTTGYYSFTGLLAGTYVVQYTPPAGQGIMPNSLASVTTGQTAAFSVAAGQSVTAPQGSLIPVSTVTGQVLLQTTGTAGVAVSLVNSSGAVAATTTSSSTGAFAFTGLAAGTYQLAYAAPAGDLLVSSPTQTVTVTTGQTVAAAAEVLAPQTCTLSGSVTASGAGKSGLTVSLLNSAGATVATTTTDSTGGFSFSGLNAGSYQVKYTAPSGSVLQTGGPADPSSGLTAPLALAAGATVSLAAEQLLTSPACITGTVAHFGGATDPVWGGGDGNVTVSLLNAAGTVIATTQTQGNGWYIFRNIGAGSYQVLYTPPAGQAIKAGSTALSSAFTVGTPAGQTVAAPSGSMVSAFTMAGSGVTDTVGNGGYVVTGNASNSTLTMGNGNQSVTLTGSGNTITIGTGTSVVNAGSGNETVHAAGGNVTITAGGTGNLFDAGAGIGFLNADGSTGNTFMTNAGGSALLTTIQGFNVTGDVLDLQRTLAGTSILADLSNVGSFITAASSGANTVLSVDPTGGHGSPQAFAVLTGLHTTVAQLQSAHDFSL